MPATNNPRSYRGIPDAVDREVGRIAVQLHVPKGEVMRALLEYALDAYQAGELQLTPRSNGGRPSLYLGQSGTQDWR